MISHDRSDFKSIIREPRHKRLINQILPTAMNSISARDSSMDGARRGMHSRTAFIRLIIENTVKRNAIMSVLLRTEHTGNTVDLSTPGGAWTKGFA